jgi:hypothetical protein
VCTVGVRLSFCSVFFQVRRGFWFGALWHWFTIFSWFGAPFADSRGFFLVLDTR